MPTQVSSIIVHENATLPAVDSDFVGGSFRTKVASVDDLVLISTDQLKQYATFVYAETGTAATEGWYYWTGTGTNNAEDWVLLNDEFGGGSLVGLQADDNNTTETTTVDISGGKGLETSITSGGNDDLIVDFTGVDDFSDGAVLGWDGTVGAEKLIDSGLTFSGSSFSFGDSSTVTMTTLNVTNINAENTYTSASVSTSDTFIRLADPTADPTAGTSNETEYERAQHAGFVINTGYYDEDFSNTGDDFALSTHKLLYWNKTLLKWVVQDGTPEVDTTSDPDTLINAENDYSSGVGRLAGTMKFVENFFLPDAQALHFGLNNVFAFNHFDGSTDPTVSSTVDKYMKTQWVVDRNVLFSWASFDQDQNDYSGNNVHQVDRSWQIDTEGGVDDDAANVMANTYVRTARFFKTKVILEAEDILSSGDDALIKVYHGGLFNEAMSLPIIKVFRKVSGSTEGSNFVYEEIMVRTRITDATDYVEIIFNPGYLVDTSVLYVRMVA